MEDPSVVIKVQYGDSLRRFHARIVNEELDLSMDSLREKIISLFSFLPDSELVLTYIDEDGDIVTIADDEDLQDVVKQALNPLRITVKLDSGKNSGQFNQPSGSSTPLRSRVQRSLPNLDSNLPETLRTLGLLCTDLASKALSSAPVTAEQKPLHDLNSDLSQILRTVQVPFHETAMKLSTDLASKASASSQSLAELLEILSKLRLSYPGQPSDSETKVRPSTQSSVPESNTVTTETNTLGKSKVGSGTSKVQKEGISEEKSFKISEGITKPQPESTTENNEVKHEKKASTSKATGFDALASAVASKTVTVGKKGKLKKDKFKKLSECYSSGKSHVTIPQLLPFANKVPTGKEVNKPYESHPGPKFVDISSSDPVKGDHLDRKAEPVFSGGFGNALGSTWPVDTGGLNSLGPVSGPGSVYECPFSGIPVANNSASPPHTVLHPLPIREISGHVDGSGLVFHRTVRCDGCGVHPITGPRFKSKVLVDYDLCSVCFSKIGNKTDYIKMDRPAAYLPPNPVNGSYGLYSGVPTLPQVCRSVKVKYGATKLDSRLIKDINIVDGTIMAPLTPFTKIWKMKNNGTVAWPQKTQLVWIGGDQLNHEFSVEVEIPVAGLPAGLELDVAVDFIAPKLPGKYVSYWKLASPSGQKFGQRVWVVIQVDASVKEMQHGNFRGFNLNLPPVSIGFGGAEFISANPEPMVEDNSPNPDPSEKTVELVKPIVDLHPNIEQEMKFPINDSLLVGSGASSLVPSAAPSFSYPVVDLSPVPPVPFSSVAPVESSWAPAVELPNVIEGEETVLRKLEDMGFKQVELNKELLRMNLYDLQKTLDDLCAIEYDPLFDEMEFSMGQR